MRQMVLVGFLQAQNCTTLASSWRHPDSRTDFTTAEYYQKIGQVLEEGKFQLAFFDDRLAMPDIYGGNPAEVVANGVRVVKMDPWRHCSRWASARAGLASVRRRPPPTTNRSTSRAGSRPWTTCWAAGGMECGDLGQ